MEVRSIEPVSHRQQEEIIEIIKQFIIRSRVKLHKTRDTDSDIPVRNLVEKRNRSMQRDAFDVWVKTKEVP